MSKNAYVIHLYNDRYLQLAKVCARSIRKFDTNNDVVIQYLSGKVSPETIAAIKQEEVILFEENPITVPKSWNKFELSKTRIWRHIEYDKILSLDADCFVTQDISNAFKAGEFSCGRTKGSPVFAAYFLIEPSLETYQDLIDIILYPEFDVNNGWKQYGKFPHWLEEGESDWRFNSSELAQGLYFYYFGLVKNKINYDWRPKIIHIGNGYKKFNGDYIRNFYNKFGLLELVDVDDNISQPKRLFQ
jgi:hypothetical protein